MAGSPLDPFLGTAIAVDLSLHGGETMNTLRSEKDADKLDVTYTYSEYRSKENPHEILCSVCAKSFYVDDETIDKLSRAMEEGRDNPFVCDDCIEDYEEIAHAAA